MPTSSFIDHQYTSTAPTFPGQSRNTNIQDASPLLAFDDSDLHSPTSLSSHSQMLFTTDLDDGIGADNRFDYQYDFYSDVDSSTSSPYVADNSALSPFLFDDPTFDSSGYIPSSADAQFHSTLSNDALLFSSWTNDSDLSISSPIPIRPNASPNLHKLSSPHMAYNDRTSFPQHASFSPSDFGSPHALPDYFGSSYPYKDPQPALRVEAETSLPTPPEWVSHLWDGSSLASAQQQQPTFTSRAPPQPLQSRHSPYSDRTQRPRARSGHLSTPLGQMFQSSSAPTATHIPAALRSYSRRAESVSESNDRDATVRRKKGSPAAPERQTPSEEPRGETSQLKPVLHPPKLAPSTWQLYFTDWIQRHQASSNRKLNVAQAAKEAGQEYATLTEEEKEPYKRKSQAAKERREREMESYLKTLSPDDIKKENAFRAEQRKLGKSRRSNIKDPNAPKKPLSAYFMFLQCIRADPQLVRNIFGDETETTKQSVLAAAKWRSMTDDERKPFLAQAERDKLEYEAARRVYENGASAAGYGHSINFSILSGNPAEVTFRGSRSSKVKVESESDSDGMADDGFHRNVF